MAENGEITASRRRLLNARLKEKRELVQFCDVDILEILAERAQLSLGIEEIKRELGMQVPCAETEEDNLAKLAKRADELGLSGESARFITELFQLIMHESRRAQLAQRKKALAQKSS